MWYIIKIKCVNYKIVNFNKCNIISYNIYFLKNLIKNIQKLQFPMSKCYLIYK